jgi:hypothetical protein
MEHLHLANQTYFEHLTQAWGFSFQSLKASIILFIHGVLPMFFVVEGGNCIIDIAQQIEQKRQKCITSKKSE